MSTCLKNLFPILLVLAVFGPYSVSASSEVHRCKTGSSEKHYTIRFQKPSLFGDVFVVDSDSKRHLRFGDACGADQSSIDLSAPDNVIVEYVRSASLSLAFAQNHNKVLVVGMGGGVFSNLLARTFSDIEIDAIEIDPVVVGVARSFFGVKATGRYRIHIEDAADYVARTKKRYDIIFLDAYDGDGIPEHLKSKAFFKRVASLLNPGGVIVANLGLDSPLVYLQLAKRLRDAVGASKCIHGKDEPNLVVIAARAELFKKADFLAGARELDEKRSLPFSLTGVAKQIKECPQI